MYKIEAWREIGEEIEPYFSTYDVDPFLVGLQTQVCLQSGAVRVEITKQITVPLKEN